MKQKVRNFLDKYDFVIILSALLFVGIFLIILDCLTICGVVNDKMGTELAIFTMRAGIILTMATVILKILSL